MTGSKGKSRQRGASKRSSKTANETASGGDDSNGGPVADVDAADATDGTANRGDDSNGNPSADDNAAGAKAGTVDPVSAGNDNTAAEKENETAAVTEKVCDAPPGEQSEEADDTGVDRRAAAKEDAETKQGAQQVEDASGASGNRQAETVGEGGPGEGGDVGAQESKAMEVDDSAVATEGEAAADDNAAAENEGAAASGNDREVREGDVVHIIIEITYSSTLNHNRHKHNRTTTKAISQMHSGRLT